MFFFYFYMYLLDGLAEIAEPSPMVEGTPIPVYGEGAPEARR